MDTQPPTTDTNVQSTAPPTPTTPPTPPPPQYHSFVTQEEAEKHLTDVVKNCIPNLKFRKLIGQFRYRLESPAGYCDMYVVLKDPAENNGYPIQVVPHYQPPLAVTHMHDEITEVIKLIMTQSFYLATYLRTGLKAPELRIAEKRPPGRPSTNNGYNNGVNTNGAPGSMGQYTSQLSEPGSYDLSFTPFTDPNRGFNEHAVIIGYYLTAISTRGQQRIKFEQDLNYPDWIPADQLRASLYFFENLNLRTVVVTPGQELATPGASYMEQPKAEEVPFLQPPQLDDGMSSMPSMAPPPPVPQEQAPPPPTPYNPFVAAVQESVG